MKFTTTSKELSEVLVNMNRVINSKNSLPILADVVFTVKENTLSLKASDSENTLMTELTLAEAEGEGSFAVNAKDIMEAVKNLPDNPLSFTIDTDTDTTVNVDYFSGCFHLPIDNAIEFPATPEISEKEAQHFTLNEGLLQENIARTIFATADDELRPVMNGIFFDLHTNHLAVVASDGHTLVRNKIFSTTAENDEHSGNFILPKKPSNILKGILRRSTEAEVTMTFDGRQVLIAAENFTMCCRLIEGRYPNYNSVIPQSNPNIVTVDRTSLIAALRRVSPFSNSNSNLVRIHMEENKMQLDTEDYDFSKTATERIVCEYNGQPMNIGLKGSKTMEILSNINSTEIVLQLADPSRAALILPSEQPTDMEITMLQMPMLLND